MKYRCKTIAISDLFDCYNLTDEMIVLQVAYTSLEIKWNDS